MTYPNDDLDRTPARRERGLSVGLMTAIAAALVLGLVLWGMADASRTTASNPGVTTTQGTTAGTAPAQPTAPARPTE